MQINRNIFFCYIYIYIYIYIVFFFHIHSKRRDSCLTCITLPRDYKPQTFGTIDYLQLFFEKIYAKYLLKLPIKVRKVDINYHNVDALYIVIARTEAKYLFLQNYETISLDLYWMIL